VKRYLLPEEAWMIPVCFGSFGPAAVEVLEHGLSEAWTIARVPREPVAPLSPEDPGRSLREYLATLTVPDRVRKAGVFVIDPGVLGDNGASLSLGDVLPVEGQVIGSRALANVVDLHTEPGRFRRRFAQTVHGVLFGSLGIVSREPLRPENTRRDPQSPVVALNTDRDLRGLMERGVAAIGGFGGLLDPGEEVIVKPNLHYHEVYPSVTRPETLESLVGLLLDAGYRVRVVESSGPDTFECAEVAGLLQVCRRLGVEFAAAEDDECVTLETGLDTIPYVEMFRVFWEARNLVCLGLAKTHRVTALTAACKHLVGTIAHPTRYVAHHAASSGDTSVIHDLIAFLNRVLAPRLTVIDAELMLLGQGPGFFTGQARVTRENLMLLGRDNLALDLWVKGYLDKTHPGWNSTAEPDVGYLARLMAG